MKKLFAFLVAIALVASIASAQLKQGAYGIQTGVTGNASVIGGVYNFSQNLRLGANLGFGSLSPSVGSSSSNFNIGAGIAYYLGTAKNLSTFIGGSLGFGSTSSGGVSGSAFNIAAQCGAES